MQVADANGNPAVLDKSTVCKTAVNPITPGKMATVVLGSLRGDYGYFDFRDMTLVGDIVSAYELVVSCELDDGVVPARGHVELGRFYTTITQCDPGSALNGEGVCASCNQNEYSPDGTSCVPCPLGGDCVVRKTFASGATTKVAFFVGTAFPTTTRGYWVSRASHKFKQVHCAEFLAAKGPCLPGNYVDAKYGCRPNAVRFDPMIVYVCMRDFQVYPCNHVVRCVGNKTEATYDARGIDADTNSASLFFDNACSLGAYGPKCDICAPGYIADGAGACVGCAADGSGKMTASEQATYMAAAVGGFIALIIGVGVLIYGPDEILILLSSAGSILLPAFLVCCACAVAYMRAREVKRKVDGAREEELAKRATKRKNLVLMLKNAKHFSGEKVKMLTAFSQVGQHAQRRRASLKCKLTHHDCAVRSFPHYL